MSFAISNALFTKTGVYTGVRFGLIGTAGRTQHLNNSSEDFFQKAIYFAKML